MWYIPGIKIIVSYANELKRQTTQRYEQPGNPIEFKVKAVYFTASIMLLGIMNGQVGSQGFYLKLHRVANHEKTKTCKLIACRSVHFRASKFRGPDPDSIGVQEL